MRTPMLVLLVAAGSLSFVSSAFAQSYLPAPIYEGRSALSVAPDEEVVVREYIIRRPIAAAPVVVAPGPVPPAPIPRAPVAFVRPGAVVPADVDIEPYVDAPVPAWRRYSYFTSPSNQVVLVDPIGRRVVRVIDRY
ncbi:MAG: hypothetical protein JOZ16_17365 [Methylobacteriaceae bacterium]|nr:hypothetical protein [Methylobacteriaceae bacterium]